MSEGERMIDDDFLRERYKILMLKAKNGKWYFRIQAGNGKCICVSEQYQTHQNTRKTVDSLMKSLNKDDFKIVYESPKPKRGK